PTKLNNDARSGVLYAGSFTAANVNMVTAGQITGAFYKCTVPYTAAKTNANTSTITIAVGPNKTRFTKAYLDVTSAFTGVANMNASLGYAAPRSNSTSNSTNAL